MEEIIMTPDVCMRFLIWAYYYHNILPEKDKSFKDYGVFTSKDAKRLDEMRITLFKCYEEASVRNACAQFALAKEKNEPCPFTQEELDRMFAKNK